MRHPTRHGPQSPPQQRPPSDPVIVRRRMELASDMSTPTLSAVRTLQAVLQDIRALMDALDENVEMFAHNFGGQQTMILRDQKSWSGRAATEKVFWMVDNSDELVGCSTDWVARD